MNDLYNPQRNVTQTDVNERITVHQRMHLATTPALQGKPGWLGLIPAYCSYSTAGLAVPRQPAYDPLVVSHEVDYVAAPTTLGLLGSAQ